MLRRAQSAIEFLTTYSFLIFVVAVVMVVLVLLTSIPSSTIPSTCSIYGSLRCAELTLGSNTITGGSELIVYAYSSVPGLINISTFNAVVGGVTSTSGFCSSDGYTAGNTTISEGSPVICIANFATPVSAGKVYTGTVNISANYCNSGSVCPATSTYSFTGGWRSQSLSVASLPITLATFYGARPFIPINIINSQLTATPSSFQQLVYFNPQTVGYPAHEASDLGNIRFYQGFTELYSWCESGCNAITSSNAVFWINLPNGIPANSFALINMTFQPTNTEYDGVYAGESAIASNTYAQFDNGANLFLGYYNMNSYPITTSSNSALWRAGTGTGPSGESQPLLQQLAFSSDFPYYYAAIKSSSLFPSSFIVSFWVQPGNNYCDTNGAGLSTNQYSGYVSDFNCVNLAPATITNAIPTWNGYGTFGSPATMATINGWEYSELDYNAGNIAVYGGAWQNTLTATGHSFLSAGGYDSTYTAFDSIIMSNYNLQAPNSPAADWALIVLRQYPPNGVMPSERLGALRKL